jgi:hypothetical protein
MDARALEWAPPPAADDEDEDARNLAEIDAAIREAEVEDFLTAQGITDIDERRGLVFELLKVRPQQFVSS